VAASRKLRIRFTVIGAVFLVISAVFLQRDLWLGAAVFAATGLYMIWQVWRRRTKGRP
jgi:hypothetical protein